MSACFVVGESGMSEARIVEFYDTMKRIEKEIQDMQRRLTDIQNTLRQIQEW